MNKGDVINTRRKVGEQITDPFAAFAVLPKFPTWLNNSAFAFVSAAAECFYLDCFTVHAIHRRLVVERVHVAWPAVHVQKNDTLCFGRELRWTGGQRTLPPALAISSNRLT